MQRTLVQLNSLNLSNFRLIANDGSLKPTAQVDWERVVVWFEKDSVEHRKAVEPEWQWDNAMFPIASVDDFDAWLDRYARHRELSEQGEEATKQRFRALRDRYLLPLRSYGFPVVTLPETTPIEAVCTVFETLNRTGKPLGPFELLTARFYPDGVNLRDLWAEAVDAYPVLDTFDIDPYSLLQGVCLRARGSAQRSDVLGRLKATDVTDHWAKIVAGITSVIDLLNAAGILTPRYLPYTMLLVPMAAVWEEIRQLQPLHRAATLARLERFFWCSVFASNYDQGANSQAGADYQKLREWLFDPDKPKPEAVNSLGLTTSVLRSATVRRKALYNGILALTVKTGAKDFHTAQTLTRFRMEQDGIDSHHVFPKAYVRDANFADTSELILNRSLIDRETNRIIGSKAPSTYLKEMKDTYGDDRLTTVLESHLVPAQPGGPLEHDDYALFLHSRLERVVQEIQTVTGCVVTEDLRGS